MALLSAELFVNASWSDYFEQWIKPALTMPQMYNVSVLTPINGHRSGSGDVFVMPELMSSFPQGSTTCWCVGVMTFKPSSDLETFAIGAREGGRKHDARSREAAVEWSVPCHSPGALEPGKGIWLHDMPAGVHELWVFLVDMTENRVIGLFPRGDRGIRVTILDDSQ